MLAAANHGRIWRMDLVALLEAAAPVVLGLAGIGGTVWGVRHQSESQRHEKRQEALREVAARTLGAARDTERNLVAMNWCLYTGLQDDEENAGKTRLEWLLAYDDSNRELQLALDELVLLSANITEEAEALRDALRLGRPPKEVVGSKGAGEQFERLRNALRDKLRTELKG